jgi:hypothetical protein
MSAWWKLLLGLFFVALGAAGTLLLLPPQAVRTKTLSQLAEEDAGRPLGQATLSPLPREAGNPALRTGGARRPTLGAGGPGVSVRAASGPLWSRFRERFGQELSPEFSQEGLLIGIQGRTGAAGQAGLGFRSNDPQAAIVRAREVVDAGRELLGLDAQWPLGDPIVKGDKRSVLVSFQEAHEGVPVAPFGNLTVVLGAAGEILRLDSSYVPGARFVNQPTLTVEQAKERALEVASAGGAPDGPTLRPEGGELVLWTSQDAAGGSQARYAYEFFVGGRRAVVDAASGALIVSKDLRHF